MPDLVGPTELQISSLTNRGQFRQALALGLGLLPRFGVEVPAPDQLGPQIGAGLAALGAWVDEGDLDSDVSRPELTEPRLVMAARLINRLMSPAYFCDHAVLGWLTLTARSLWAEHGPCRYLAGPVAHAGPLTIVVLDDYGLGYRAVRRILAVSEARGYTEVTAQVRFLLTTVQLGVVRAAGDGGPGRRGGVRGQPARRGPAPRGLRQHQPADGDARLHAAAGGLPRGPRVSPDLRGARRTRIAPAASWRRSGSSSGRCAARRRHRAA